MASDKEKIKELEDKLEKLKFDYVELEFELEDTKDELDYFQKRDDIIADKLGDEWLDSLSEALSGKDGDKDD